MARVSKPAHNLLSLVLLTALISLVDSGLIVIFGNNQSASIRSFMSQWGIDSGLRGVCATAFMSWAAWIACFFAGFLYGFVAIGKMQWIIPLSAALGYELLDLWRLFRSAWIGNIPINPLGSWIGLLIAVVAAIIGWSLAARISASRRNSSTTTPLTEGG